MTFNNKIKNYMYLCITMLMLSLYIVFFPFFSKILNFISPHLTKCVYNTITSKPCPLCGGTRFIAGIKDNLGNLAYFNCFFGYIVFFVFFEILFRSFIILYMSIKRNDKMLKNFAMFDIVCHIIAFVLFVMYEIIYIINN